jgi:hypothetical protein
MKGIKEKTILNKEKKISIGSLTAIGYLCSAENK